MKIGDKFKFNIELMKKHNINIPPDRDKIHTILEINYEEGIGEYVKYEPYAEINIAWITPVNEISHAAAMLGRKGGSVKSEKKAKSSRENGKKGGRPKTKKV